MSLNFSAKVLEKLNCQKIIYFEEIDQTKAHIQSDPSKIGYKPYGDDNNYDVYNLNNELLEQTVSLENTELLQKLEVIPFSLLKTFSKVKNVYVCKSSQDFYFKVFNMVYEPDFDPIVGIEPEEVKHSGDESSIDITIKSTPLPVVLVIEEGLTIDLEIDEYLMNLKAKTYTLKQFRDKTFDQFMSPIDQNDLKFFEEITKKLKLKEDKTPFSTFLTQIKSFDTQFTKYLQEKMKDDKMNESFGVTLESSMVGELTQTSKSTSMKSSESEKDNLVSDEFNLQLRKTILINEFLQYLVNIGLAEGPI